MDHIDDLCKLCFAFHDGQFEYLLTGEGSGSATGSGSGGGGGSGGSSDFGDSTTMVASGEGMLNDSLASLFNHSSSIYNYSHTLSYDDIDRICHSVDESDCVKQSIQFLLKHHLPQIILTFIAMILNIAEMNLMRKRKRYFPSEYLMVSLAVADLLFSFFVCATMITSLLNNRYEFLENTFLLEIISGNLISFSIFASIVHVVSISLDRLFAVITPLRHRAAVCGRRMKMVVTMIWCATIVLTGSIAIYQYNDGVKDEEHPSYAHAAKAVSAIMYISAAIVAAIYVVLTRKLMVHAKFLRAIRKTQRHGVHKKPSRTRVETVALFSAVIVTVAFIVCTLPYATLHMLTTEVSEHYETIVQCFLICNSICNPLVYFWRGYWFKSRRTKSSGASAVTELSRSKDEVSQITIATLTRSAAVMCIPVRAGHTQSGSYDLINLTLFDIFDFDSISRFRKFDRSYYYQNRHAFDNASSKNSASSRSSPVSQSSPESHVCSNLRDSPIL